MRKVRVGGIELLSETRRLANNALEAAFERLQEDDELAPFADAVSHGRVRTYGARSSDPSAFELELSDLLASDIEGISAYAFARRETTTEPETGRPMDAVTVEAAERGSERGVKLVLPIPVKNRRARSMTSLGAPYVAGLVPSRFPPLGETPYPYMPTVFARPRTPVAVAQLVAGIGRPWPAGIFHWFHHLAEDPRRFACRSMRDALFAAEAERSDFAVLRAASEANLRRRVLDDIDAIRRHEGDAEADSFRRAVVAFAMILARYGFEAPEWAARLAAVEDLCGIGPESFEDAFRQ